MNKDTERNKKKEISMLKINEYAYNACERNGTLESYALFEKRICELKNYHLGKQNATYSWIYLGFEFCENMMRICDILQMEKKIETAVKRGYKVAFVFPPVYQKSIPMVKQWIERLKKLNLISEWVVNDFGMFALLAEAGITKNFVLGRLFEKAIRETRQNILEIPEVAKNFEILQPTESMKSICRILEEKYMICGAEVDTFPDGMLKLTDQHLEYRVHYPDIFLSYSPYCEYANVNHEEKGCFVLHQLCGAECCLYEQKISAPKRNEFYKTGNVMLGRQVKCPEECIEGCCRFVYSERIHLK